MKKIVLFLSISVAAGLLITNIYNSIVDAKSWGADMPASIQAARAYFHYINPGNFFRIFSPVNQVLGLLTLILFWKTKSVRIYFLIAFLLYLAGDALTFAYFYPRNAIIFNTSIADNLEQIKIAVGQWEQINWVRSGICFSGLIFSFMGLDKYYKSVNS